MAAGPEIRLKPPEIAAKKYLDRTRTAVPYYIYGTRNPKRSPTAAALEAAEAWHSKVSAPETLEKWKKRRAAAGDDKYYFGLETKGYKRYPEGTEVGSVYMLDFLTKFYPHLAEGLRKVYAIQKKTLDDAVKRAETMIRHNATFTYEPSKISAAEARSVLERLRALRVE